MKAFAGNSIIKGAIETIIRNVEPLDFKDKTVLITGGAGFLGS